MFLTDFMKGTRIGLGLGIVAGLGVYALMTYASLPRPTLHLSQASPDESVVSAVVKYDRFYPLPKLSVNQPSGEVLHHVIKRVKLSDGAPAIKVTVLIDAPEGTRHFGWI
jgi:hypothetical protein